MFRLGKYLVVVELILSACTAWAQNQCPNSMSYHEVQGFEIKIGYFAGKTVDTYYLLISNSPDQFSSPQRLVLGVNKERAMTDLNKILEYMNRGVSFVYTDKTGTAYHFTRSANSRRYTISWEGSDNGYCPVVTQAKSIERSIKWLASTPSKNESQELLVKTGVDNTTQYTYAYSPTIQIVNTLPSED